MIKNMSIGARLSAGFGVLLCLMFLLGVLGHRAFHALSSATVHLLEGDAHAAEHASRAWANVVGMRLRDRNEEL
jgi:hypothetical protein